MNKREKLGFDFKNKANLAAFVHTSNSSLNVDVHNHLTIKTNTDEEQIRGGILV